MYSVYPTCIRYLKDTGIGTCHIIANAELHGKVKTQDDDQANLSYHNKIYQRVII